MNASIGAALMNKYGDSPPQNRTGADVTGRWAGGWLRLPPWLGGRHFSVVTPGVLSRSAMPTPEMIEWLQQTLGIRSVVTFREKEEGDWEEDAVVSRGLRFYSFDMGSKRPPYAWQVERWRTILADPANRPIHCHCQGGADRTGLMVALYRIEHEGWAIERALKELTLRGGVRDRSKLQRHWLQHTYAEARAVVPASGSRPEASANTGSDSA